MRLFLLEHLRDGRDELLDAHHALDLRDRASADRVDERKERIPVVRPQRSMFSHRERGMDRRESQEAYVAAAS